MKRLSVIVPGYNNPESRWKRCVASVRMACGPDDEIICVDDGSVIHVEDVWIGADVDPRVKLIRKDNGGLSSARNVGLAVAEGRFVTFVDSDDEVTAEVYERCIQVIEKCNSDIAIYGSKTIWPSDGLEKVDGFACDEDLGVMTPAMVRRIYDANLLNSAANKVYRKSFIEGNNLSFSKEGMPCEDIIFNLSAIMANAKFCSVSCIGYRYYRTRDTLLSRYKPTSSEGIRIARGMWEKYKESIRGANEVLGGLGECSLSKESEIEWRNIWMPGSPYSMYGRWEWLKRHPELGRTIAFVKMMLWIFVRKHFYFRFVRRWHIKRLFPNAREWRQEYTQD